MVMKKEQNKSENYLERIPVQTKGLTWTLDDDGRITFHIENKGMWNRIAQKILKKPKISHIHLDEMGSFLFAQLDGQRNLIVLGGLLREAFGEKAEPLYERLSQYFQILESYHFIEWSRIQKR